MVVGLFVAGVADVGWCERDSPQRPSASAVTGASATESRTPAMELALRSSRSPHVADATPLGPAARHDIASMEAEALEAELGAGIAPQRGKTQEMASPEGWVGLIP